MDTLPGALKRIECWVSKTDVFAHILGSVIPMGRKAEVTPVSVDRGGDEKMCHTHAVEH